MSAIEQLLPTFEPTPIELVRSMTPSQRLDRAIALLREHEPAEGYYLAFSGGKDSCAIKKLAQLAEVKFEAWYSNVTIDPPELVRFIKEHHQDVQWHNPYMPMMVAVAKANKLPPTRLARWCCEIYKEQGGNGRVCIFGVRAAESKRRELMWREVRDDHDKKKLIVCPIVYWSDENLWAFIDHFRVPVCSLYKEGFTRLGCVGCPLAAKGKQELEFQRWPRFEANWKKAVIANWYRMKDRLREDGNPYMHAIFKTGEEFWQWWRYERKPDLYREECQTGLLWTNQELDEEL